MKASPVWIGALVAGSTAAFYFWQKNGSSKDPQPATGVPDAATPLPSASTSASGSSGSRTPSAANGHVRDVQASDPPAPDTGTNFTVQGDVHQPGSSN